MNDSRAPQATRKGNLLRSAIIRLKRLGMGLLLGVSGLIGVAWGAASEGDSFADLGVQIFAAGAFGLYFIIGFFGYEPGPSGEHAAGGLTAGGNGEADAYPALLGLDSQSLTETISRAGSAAAEGGSGLLEAAGHMAKEALEALGDLLRELKD